MTNQLQGEILFKGWDASESQWAYSPWAPVRGDIATFGVQVLARDTVTLTWNVETRTAEDPSTVAALFASDQTAASVSTFVATSGAVKAKQWFRYRFATGSGASASLFVMFRALQPSWEVNR